MTLIGTDPPPPQSFWNTVSFLILKLSSQPLLALTKKMQEYFSLFCMFPKFLYMISLFFVIMKRVLSGIPNLAATTLFFIKDFSFKKDRISIFFIVKTLNFLFTPAIFSSKMETRKCEMILLPLGYKLRVSTNSISKKLSSHVSYSPPLFKAHPLSFQRREPVFRTIPMQYLPSHPKDKTWSVCPDLFRRHGDWWDCQWQ